MSTDPIDRRELNAYLDGELDLARQLALETRLAREPAARSELESLRGVRDAVRDRADYHAAPVELLAKLQWSQATSPAATPSAGWRRWFDWRPWVPAFALAGAVFWALHLGIALPDHDTRLMQEVIASHVRSTVGQKLVDVASSDRHTVKPWLSSHLDYSPPVADVPVPGAVFLGGRIDYLDDRPVAVLVYRQRQHVIDAYIWPTDAVPAAATTRAQRGFNTIHWVRGGMRYWLVSDINRDELAGFATALDRAEATP